MATPEDSGSGDEAGGDHDDGNNEPMGDLIPTPVPTPLGGTVDGLPMPEIRTKDGTVIDCNAPPPGPYTTACEVALNAERFYAGLGWYGTDGKGKGFAIAADIACGENGAAGGGVLHVSECELASAAGDEGYAAAVVHEFTHVFQGTDGTWDYTGTGAAITEGLAQLSEWEVTGGAKATAAGPLTDSVLVDGVPITAGDAHSEGVPVMRVGAWIAKLIAEKKGAALTDASSYDWHAEAKLRIAATQYAEDRYSVGGSLDFAGLRSAYIDAAKEQGVSEDVITMAFDAVGL